jgi:glycosyltransferase involved in cell wall biosynthesis
MKVLFLHTDTNEMLPEYKVHSMLARHAPAGSLDAHFVWQGPPFLSEFISESEVVFCDFGRDMSIIPKPSRIHRAALMGGKVPTSILSLLSITRSLRPDIIYTSGRGRDVIFARMLSRTFRIPHVVHHHSNLGPWVGRRILSVLCNSKHALAVSEFTRQTAILSGASPENICTLLNPIQITREMNAEDDLKAKRAELGYAPNSPLILSVGRLDPGKGHLPLFEAFVQVAKAVPSARLLVCGKSTLRNDYAQVLQERLRELKLTEHVTIAGFRSDVRSLMRCADVFCLPTELDPCPLVFLEAASEGLPSVAFYSGGVPELIRHGETGLLSYPNDIDGLACNLRCLIEDRESARRLGRAAQRRALEEFNPTLVAKRWMDLLQQFVAGHAQSRPRHRARSP